MRKFAVLTLAILFLVPFAGAQQTVTLTGQTPGGGGVNVEVIEHVDGRLETTIYHLGNVGTTIDVTGAAMVKTAGGFDVARCWEIGPPAQLNVLVVREPFSNLWQINGNITAPAVNQGATGATWVPNPVTGIDNYYLQLLETAIITLSWENGPTGGADLGIGVGNGNSFNYWNQEFQTTLGVHSETLELDQDALLELGAENWVQLQVGPSISTGQFAVTDLPYELEISLFFAAAEVDGTCGLRATGNHQTPAPASETTAEKPENSGDAGAPEIVPGGDEKEQSGAARLVGSLFVVAAFVLIIAVIARNVSHPKQ